jgi:hypothetical protein
MEGVLRTTLKLHASLVFGLAVLTVVIALVPSLYLNICGRRRGLSI